MRAVNGENPYELFSRRFRRFHFERKELEKVAREGFCVDLIDGASLRSSIHADVRMKNRCKGHCFREKGAPMPTPPLHSSVTNFQVQSLSNIFFIQKTLIFQLLHFI